MRVQCVRSARSLTSALLVCLALPSVALAAERNLSVGSAARMAAAGNVVLVDVRSPAEWRMTGVARDARQITMHGPDGIAGMLAGLKRVTDGDKSRAVAVICARGNRSARVAEILKQHGYTAVHNVREGMLGRDGQPGWIGSDLPVRSCNC